VSTGQKVDVYFYEAFEEETEALRRHLPTDWRAGFTRKTIQEAGDTEPPARLISIRTQSAIPVTWMTKLSGVLSRTTGYDTVRGLPVACGYLPSYCSRAVAEQAMLLWMALLRKLPTQMQHFTNFNRDELTGSECAGKKLLVVGVGNIGSEIVKIGLGLGMTVRGVDLIEKYPSTSYVSIEEGLPWADIIICAMNLTPDNVGYFNYTSLKRARPGAFFINVARGEHAPTADLVRLLDEGHLAGVGLDVYENEGALAVALRAEKVKFPLLGRPNVILTPHNAFNTAEAVERKAEQSVQQIEHFRTQKKFLWPVPN
jgi:D-lactate dehydrogenase